MLSCVCVGGQPGCVSFACWCACMVNCLVSPSFHCLGVGTQMRPSSSTWRQWTEACLPTICLTWSTVDMEVRVAPLARSALRTLPRVWTCLVAEGVLVVATVAAAKEMVVPWTTSTQSSHPLCVSLPMTRARRRGGRRPWQLGSSFGPSPFPTLSRLCPRRRCVRACRDRVCRPGGG